MNLREQFYMYMDNKSNKVEEISIEDQIKRTMLVPTDTLIVEKNVEYDNSPLVDYMLVKTKKDENQIIKERNKLDEIDRINREIIYRTKQDQIRFRQLERIGFNNSNNSNSSSGPGAGGRNTDESGNSYIDNNNYIDNYFI